MDRLDSLTDKRIVYIQAPAGYGKTVAASLWLEGQRREKALVTLDPFDDEPSALCRRICMALSQLDPANEAIRRGAEFTADGQCRCAPLILENARADRAGILVIDDFHHLSDPAAHRLMEELYIGLPRAMRWVIISRTAPPPWMAAARERGELGQITAGHLRFDTEEIRSYFARNGVAISTPEAAKLARRTGGWAMGIGAALLTAEDTGREPLLRHLNQYIKTQIWDGLDADTRTFLLHCASQEELTPSLCRAMTGNPHSGELLEELTRDKALAERDAEGTYRLHPLFRDFLLEQLLREGPQEEIRQLTTAGRWHLSRGNYYRAAESFAGCGNRDGVVETFVGIVFHDRNQFDIERLGAVIGSTLDEKLAEANPFLYFMLAWAACVEGRPQDMLRYLDRYYEAWPQINARYPDKARHLSYLSLLDPRIPLRLAAGHVRSLGAEPQVVTGSVTHHLPLFHRSFRDFSELAVGDVETNVRQFTRASLPMLGEETEVYADCLLGGLYYERGELSRALERAQSAVRKAGETFTAGEISTEARFCALMLLAHVYRAMWRFSDAEQVSWRLRALPERDKSGLLAFNVDAWLHRCRIADGDDSAAEQWLARQQASPYELLHLSRAYGLYTTVRAYIALDRVDSAIILLNRICNQAREYSRSLDEIEAYILLADCYGRKGRVYREEAAKNLSRAIALAAPYEYTQIFFLYGALLEPLLHQLSAQPWEKDFPAAFGEKLIRQMESVARHVAPTGKRHRQTVSYTRQQQAVMRLLCEGKSYREIAGSLGIKFSTVRSHIELIYKKLEVANETEAVLKIRELGLLEDVG
ncbi:LuxR C-terminal-related transcriptional regulator [Ruminococcaceae bacterium OttesenSCG-928-L11]|nr:LuxR C-terminal-related transcriptional regulator [Ruminococcaceae bacterium OttesenSCG-928-L11]